MLPTTMAAVTTAVTLSTAGSDLGFRALAATCRSAIAVLQKARESPAQASFADVHLTINRLDLATRLNNLQQFATEFHSSSCSSNDTKSCPAVYPVTVTNAIRSVEKTVADLQQTLHDVETAQAAHEARILHTWRSASCDVYVKQLEEGSKLLDSRWKAFIEYLQLWHFRSLVPDSTATFPIKIQTS